MIKTKFKKGFTLAEMMAVIAITIILFGVGGVAAASIRRGLNQTDADAMARQIYVTAQENLTKLKAAGKYNNSAKGTKLEYEPTGAGDYKDNLYYFDNNYVYTDAKGNSTNLPDLLVPDVLAIDKSNDSYVIEFDPDLGIITGVFYATNSDYTNYYNNDSSVNVLRERENRLSFYDTNKYYVGYYGDGFTDVGDNNKNKNILDGKIIVSNAEQLEITFDVTSTKDSIKQVNLDIVYYGVDSGATMVQNINGLNLSSKHASVKYLLDSLETGKDFNTIFNHPVSEDLKVGNRVGEQKFYPGENIEVSLIAYATGNTTISSYPAIETFNSLFAASDSTALKEKTVYIEYTRHLQNLDADRCLNNVELFQVTKAIQIGDIDIFVDEGENFAFEPIVNDSIISYDGKGNSIKNLNIESQVDGTYKAAGLFAEYGKLGADSVIKNLNLVNAKVLISSNEYAGALIGKTAGPVTIDGCGVYQSDADFTLKDSFINKKAQEDAHITAKIAGGLVGYGSSNLVITNSFASTVITADSLVGGLVGQAANGATIKDSYSDCYLGGTGGESGKQKAIVGGLAGSADLAVINNVYTAGFTMGFVDKAAGFIPNSIKNDGENILSAYTILDYTSASVQIPTVTLIVGEKATDRVRYVEDYTDTKKLENKNPAGLPVNVGNLLDKDILANVLGEGNHFELTSKATHPYNYEDLGLMSYSYPTIKDMEHYGDWEDSKYGSLAFFYWEYEQGGDEGYHYYLVKTNDDVISTLCEDHDDGGDVTKYGYGYVIKKSEEDNWDVLWDTLTVSADREGMDTSMTAGLKKVMDPTDRYNIYAYRTLDPKYDVFNRSSIIDKGIDFINSLFNSGNFSEALTEEAQKTLFMLGFARCSCTEFRMKNSDTSYYYTFNCFFAKDITLGKVVDYYLNNNLKEDIDKKYSIDPSENEGLRTRYIRSIEQLQYINWNCYTCNCHSTPSPTIYRFYPYLQRLGDGLGLIKANFSLTAYEQTHDINADGFDYTPIAELGVSGSSVLSTLFAYDWFNSSYNGNSYLIRNLDIIQDSFSIGLFGTTVGAKLENIIMISDDGTGVIKKLPGGTSSSNSIGDYYIGGIVGIAADDNFKLIEASVNGADYIKNCAIGGYTIIDNSSVDSFQAGGSCVGGIAGYSGATIENCTAVVDIYMNTTSENGKVYIGGIAGSANNGITMNLTNIEESGLYRDYTILNCYSGGSITFGNCKKQSEGVLKQKHYFYTGGITGGNYQISISNINWGIVSYPIKIKNCYTYMELPAAETGDTIIRNGAIVGGFEYTTRLTPNKLDDCYYNRNKVGGVNKYGYIENDDDSRVIVRYNGTEGNMIGYTSEEMTANKVNSAQKTYTCQRGKVGNYPFDAMVTRGATYIHVGKYPGKPTNTKVTFSSGISAQAYDQVVLNYNGALVNDSTITTTMEANKLSVANIPTFDSTKYAPFDASKPQGYSRFKGYYYGDQLIVNPDGTFVEDSVLFSNGKWSFDTSEITLTAKFELIDYSITLTGLSADTQIENDLDNPLRYTAETPTFALPSVYEDGMRFTGWLGEDITTPLEFVEIEQGSTGNRTYEAQWAPFTITYVLNMENVENPNPSTYSAAQTRNGAITLKPLQKDGLTFVGWYSDEGLTNKVTEIPKNSKGNLTFYAKWDIATYTATFDANGGTFANGKSTNEVEYSVVTGIKQTQVLTPSIGYEFLGWKVTAVGQGDKAGNWVLDETDPLTSGKYGDVTFTAQWGTTPNTYNVKFMKNDGTDASYTQSGFTYGVDKALQNNSFTRTGYTFAGWADSSSATTKTYSDGQTVKNLTTVSGGAKVLYAVWTANTYTIKFDANGGSGSMSDLSMIYDTANNLTDNKFTRTGYTFAGWKDEAGNNYSAGQSVKNLTTENGKTIILYAQWTANTYTIKFDKNSGSGSMISMSMTYDDVAKELTKNTFTRTGYTFAGWNTKKDGTGTSYTDGQSVKNLTSVNGKTITLYAQWTANKYTIKFNKNGGSGSMSDLPMTYGVVKELTKNTFTKTGYTFAGWNKKKDGTGTSYTDGQSVSKLTSKDGGSVTLYAQWTANTYTIKFDANGGSGSMSDLSMTYDTANNLTDNKFTRTGYTFAGWKDEAGNNYSAGQSVKNLTTENGKTITLYAQWTAITYKVQFMPNGGTGNPYTQTEFTYDTEKALTSNANTIKFTRTGYTFTGWADSSDATTATYTDGQTVKNLTTVSGGTKILYAVWTGNTYYVNLSLENGSLPSGVISPLTKTYGTSLTLPEPTKTGYTFDGWWTGAGGTGAQYTTSLTADLSSTQGASVTLYAKWKANKYKITFKIYAPNQYDADNKYEFNYSGKASNEGGGEDYTVDLDYSDTVTIPARKFTIPGFKTPTTSNYPNNYPAWTTHTEKSKWEYIYDQATLNVILTALSNKGLEPEHDTQNDVYKITLYGKWDRNNYKLTYEKNGGSGNTINPDKTSYSYTDAFRVKNNTYTKTGYTANGWSYVDDNGETKLLSDNAKVYALTAIDGKTVKLKAEWTANKYKIKFNANGGSGSMSDLSMTYDTANNLTANTFTRTGYTFAGWKDEAGNNYSAGQSVNNLTTENGKTITLYAVWAPITYSVSLNIENGLLPYGTTNPISKTYGINCDLPKPINPTGYTFGGWWTGAGGAGTKYEASLTGDLSSTQGASVTLYAKWNPITYNVSLSLAKGSLPSGVTSPLTKTYGTKLDLPQPTMPTGYTFAGWYTGVGGTGTQYTPSLTTDLSSSQGDTVTLYAKITYVLILTVDSDQGALPSGWDRSQIKTYDVDLALPEATPKGDRTFVGWYTAKNKGGDKYTGVLNKDLELNDDHKAKLYAGWDNGCVASGTSITMADGSIKKIDDISIGDNILTFDHYSGKLSAKPVIYIFESEELNSVIDLTFENGKTLSIVNEHGLFDTELLEYVIINKDNVTNYVGHNFYSVDENGPVKLVNAECSEKVVKAYSIMTAYDINAIANGFLTISDDIDAVLSPFEYDNNMKYNVELMQADIDKYGITDYEEYEAYCMKDEFDVFNCKYIAVNIGKGRITKEEVIDWMLKYTFKYENAQSKKNCIDICFNSEESRKLIDDYEK